MRVTVVGAGIAGLTAAHRLAAAGVDVRVLEREDRPGGRMSTQPLGAGVMERGAQFLSTGYELIPELVRTAGLADELVRVSGRTLAVADDRSLRFHTGRPHTLLSSGLLRARDVPPALRGLWSSRRLFARGTDDLARWTDLGERDGSAWTRARFGSGVTDRVTALTVHGLFFQELAANSAALPGALTAFLARGSGALTLRGGLGRPTAALAAELDVEHGVRVECVRLPESPAGGVALTTSKGPRQADAVVLATPAASTAGMLADPTPDEAAVLRTPYSPALLAGLALAEPLADEELGGAYGVLVAPGSRSPLAGDHLGFPWSDSAAFNGRWAADRLLADLAG